MEDMAIEKIVGDKAIFTHKYYKKLCEEAKKRGITPEKLFNKIVADYLRKVKNQKRDD